MVMQAAPKKDPTVHRLQKECAALQKEYTSLLAENKRLLAIIMEATDLDEVHLIARTAIARSKKEEPK